MRHRLNPLGRRRKKEEADRATEEREEGKFALETANSQRDPAILEGIFEYFLVRILHIIHI